MSGEGLKERADWLRDNFDLTECEHGFRLYAGYSCPNEDCERRNLADIEKGLREALTTITTLQSKLAEAEKLIETFSKVHGVLTERDRERFRSTLATIREEEQ